MTYNRPDTVYYKLSKKILHAGFKMMSKQAALLGNEETAVEEPVPEVVPVQVETAKKSKRPSREVISCMFEPEGNDCSLTDSTSYSDVSLDISMLSSLGKEKKELDHDDSHLNLDETTKLLQDLHEAQAERSGAVVQPQLPV
ncbi:Bromodomain-containing protein 9 [Myotis brandtii]|uniref:Bromodomain-containing protein 9 n=1 Tax=Myotis brandtii TaxID=109478 RepID=S7MXF0_MYOBR|nr:Bromodomain-containing protein 9 [Myotis brandtii]